MGQRIGVKSTQLGDVALFSLDRSLTGQPGEVFETMPPSDDGTTAAGLARRLFAGDPAIRYVFVASNEVVVSRTGGWDRSALEAVTGLLGGLLVFYPEHLTTEAGPPEPDPAPTAIAGPEVEEPPAPPPAVVALDEEREELRRLHYNATIEEIIEIHGDLWIVRILADGDLPTCRPGQYITLALGFWEPRVDGLDEGLTPDQRTKLARRSYSVSSSILGDDGQLLELPSRLLEFYVVLVRGEDPLSLPALTPRLFTKAPGDRIFMGGKFAGRYMIDDLDPDADAVFLSTGTGEAPHNLMIQELLRRGHRGRLLSVACVRYARDLGYEGVHRTLEGRYPQYRYLTLTTRETTPKQYIQDLVVSGEAEEALGAPLDPAGTHVYLCGNPAMIGLPRTVDGSTVFPDPPGVVELLVERGFTLGSRREPGNIHYEEYWKPTG